MPSHCQHGKLISKPGNIGHQIYLNHFSNLSLHISSLIISNNRSREMDTTTTFHRFNDLPPELRVQIWIFSLPPPSLLIEKNLQVKHHGVEWGHILKLRPVSRFLTPPCRFVPPPLHVCRESRGEFLNADGGSSRQDVRRNGHEIFNHYVLKSGRSGGFVSLGMDEIVLSMDSMYSPISSQMKC